MATRLWQLRHREISAKSGTNAPEASLRFDPKGCRKPWRASSTRWGFSASDVKRAKRTLNGQVPFPMNSNSGQGHNAPHIRSQHRRHWRKNIAKPIQSRGTIHDETSLFSSRVAAKTATKPDGIGWLTRVLDLVRMQRRVRVTDVIKLRFVFVEDLPSLEEMLCADPLQPIAERF
ncbi:MAG: hypothetical protein NTW75_12310 [Planctomycetales bacterium]|nr:hypothetical protein [Planctomycetales bacterium]